MSAPILILTVADLRAAGAIDGCWQVERFKATFPDGAPLAAESMDRAIAAGLKAAWAECLLDADAWAEYRRATAPAWDEYRRTTAPAWAKYQHAIAPALLAGLVATWQRRAAQADECAAVQP